MCFVHYDMEIIIGNNFLNLLSSNGRGGRRAIKIYCLMVVGISGSGGCQSRWTPPSSALIWQAVANKFSPEETEQKENEKQNYAQ
jgi:hypothetical protein